MPKGESIGLLRCVLRALCVLCVAAARLTHTYSSHPHGLNFALNFANATQVVRADIDVDALQNHHQQQQLNSQSKQHQEQKRHHHPLSAAGGPQLLGSDGSGSRMAAAPEWAVPSSGWVRQFVKDFQQLRRHVAEVYETGGACVLLL